MPGASPEQIAHYAILDRLAARGLGDVYRARDTREGRTVALTVVSEPLAADPKFLEAAQAAATLSHPSIAVLFEVGEDEGQRFLAAEYVAGENVRQSLGGGAVPPRRAVPIAIQVADALAEAHAAGIIHGDLKPENIVITPKGSTKVLDLGLGAWTIGGIARQRAASGAAVEPELVASSVAYMSPEQVLAQPLDARSDVFSFGVVLYEMLTGRNPFAAPAADATLINILKVQPEPPSKANSQVPEALDEPVMRMLVRDVQTRASSAAAVASELRAAFGERTEHVIEEDVEHPLPARGTRSRRGVLIAAGLALIVAVGAGLAYPKRATIRAWMRHQFGSAPAPVLVVVPFSDEGRAETTFADGLTDDVMMRMGQTPGLSVVGRSAARSFRGREPAEVARQTGAAVVLTGAIQRSAGDLKLDLNLIDASDGVRIWNQQFTSPSNSVIAGQAVIAEEVAKALKLSVAPAEIRERTLSRSDKPEAYETYTRARAALAQRQFDEAVKLFEQAASLDGGLAEAYAGLAQALYRRAASAGGGLPEETQARLREAVSRAAAIDPDVASVELAASLVAPTLRESLRHLVRAAKLDASYAAAYRALADLIAPLDSTRAGVLNARARRLDPQAPAERMFDTPASVELRKELETNRERVRKIVDDELSGLPK